MYIISQITVLDDDKELYETYVGLDNKEKTLLFSAWGKTEKESRTLANRVASILNHMADTSIKGEGAESEEELAEEFPYPLGHTLP